MSTTNRDCVKCEVLSWWVRDKGLRIISASFAAAQTCLAVENETHPSNVNKCIFPPSRSKHVSRNLDLQKAFLPPVLGPLIPRCSSDYGQIPAAGSNVFSDEKEEVQVPSAFHAGRAHSSAFCQRSSFLQDPASGWWGLRHHVIQVGHFLIPYVKSLLRVHLCLMRPVWHSVPLPAQTPFSRWVTTEWQSFQIGEA